MTQILLWEFIVSASLQSDCKSGESSEGSLKR
jgi:hypothetical protein